MFHGDRCEATAKILLSLDSFEYGPERDLILSEKRDAALMNGLTRTAFEVGYRQLIDWFAGTMKNRQTSCSSGGN